MDVTARAQIAVRVDTANPGQFFACCGLLELAARLWGDVEGWFDGGEFLLRAISPVGAIALPTLVDAIFDADLRDLDPADERESPISIAAPFDLRLDWWRDRASGGREFKVWAGSMGVGPIARAMRSVLGRPEYRTADLLQEDAVVFGPSGNKKKRRAAISLGVVPVDREPFYFDARRGSAARAIDVGFSTDSLDLTSAVYPAVEFLCLVGLQRFRPSNAGVTRVFAYQAWEHPLPARVAPAGALGLLPYVGGNAFRFEVVFRTDQRKHKAFAPASFSRRFAA